MLILHNKIQYYRADYYNTREIRNNRILCPVIKDTFYIIFLRRAQNKVQLFVLQAPWRLRGGESTQNGLRGPIFRCERVSCPQLYLRIESFKKSAYVTSFKLLFWPHIKWNTRKRPFIMSVSSRNHFLTILKTLPYQPKKNCYLTVPKANSWQKITAQRTKNMKK